MKKALFIICTILLIPALSYADKVRKYESSSYDAESSVLYGYNGSNLTPISVDSSGRVAIAGSYLQLVDVPEFPNANGTLGQVAIDNTTFYLVTSTNTWGKITISEWLLIKVLVYWQGVQVNWQGANVQR